MGNILEDCLCLLSAPPVRPRLISGESCYSEGFSSLVNNPSLLFPSVVLSQHAHLGIQLGNWACVKMPYINNCLFIFCFQ